MIAISRVFGRRSALSEWTIASIWHENMLGYVSVSVSISVSVLSKASAKLRASRNRLCLRTSPSNIFCNLQDLAVCVLHMSIRSCKLVCHCFGFKNVHVFQFISNRFCFTISWKNNFGEKPTTFEKKKIFYVTGYFSWIKFCLHKQLVDQVSIENLFPSLN